MPIRDETLLDKYPGKTLEQAKKEYFGAAGRIGGSFKGKKGLASMTPERRREIQSMGGKANKK